MRRAFDFVVAAVALILLSPILILVTLAVRLTSHGPVIYRAERMGLGRKPFMLYKFRTMRHGADGLRVTAHNDPRITPLGRVLRRWKLDEIPQLLNVLRGDMALVGPRPEDEAYLQFYSTDEMRLFDVRPGITSPVTLRFRDEEKLLDATDGHRTYIDAVLHEKLRGELEYLQRRTFWTDLGVLLQTLRHVPAR